MIILALDAALARCSACVVADGVVLAQRHQDGGRGQAALLAPMVAEVLAEAKLAAAALTAVAVTVGPGSFTGLRAAISLAQGIVAGAGCPLIGVTVAEALIAALPVTGRDVWVAIDSRRDRVFLLRGADATACALSELPQAAGRIAVAGDAAIAVASRLAARGTASVMLTDARLPDAAIVAVVAARRLVGELPALAVEPIYIDAPEAKLPAGGLRPSPSPAGRGPG